MSQSTPAPAATSTWKTLQPFVFGGVSGMTATAIIQPIDMVKVRIQLQGEKGNIERNPIRVAKSLIKAEGFLSMYRGLSAGLLRQATYTTSRMGIFNSAISYIKNQQKKNGQAPTVTFGQRAGAGLVAGALGAVIGTPADVALVRMQADGMLPMQDRRNYKNVVDALLRMSKEEGVLSLWRGCMPTVARAMALNVGMLATYDQAKTELAKHYGKGPVVNFGASAIAGFFASFLSLPFDFVKTRVQKQKPGPDGKLPYKNSIHAAMRIAQTEGPLAFYAGFTTFYFRIAPHAMLTLLISDALVTFVRGRQ